MLLDLNPVFFLLKRTFKCETVTCLRRKRGPLISALSLLHCGLHFLLAPVRHTYPIFFPKLNQAPTLAPVSFIPTAVHNTSIFCITVQGHSILFKRRLGVWKERLAIASKYSKEKMKTLNTITTWRMYIRAQKYLTRNYLPAP